MEDYRQVLGENVRTVRQSLDLSQEALAHQSEIDRSYISGIELGKRKRSLDLIGKLADTLKTTPSHLLTPKRPA